MHTEEVYCVGIAGIKILGRKLQYMSLPIVLQEKSYSIFIKSILRHRAGVIFQRL